MQAYLTDENAPPGPPGGFSHTQEPTSRLEPLAVPLGRLKSILRRQLWVILAAFVLASGGTALVVKQHAQAVHRRGVHPDRAAAHPGQRPAGHLTGFRRSRRPGSHPDRHLALARTATWGRRGAAPDRTGRSSCRRPAACCSKSSPLLQMLGLMVKPPVVEPTQKELNEIAAAVLSAKIGFANEIRSSVLRVMVTTRRPGPERRDRQRGRQAVPRLQAAGEVRRDAAGP